MKKNLLAIAIISITFNALSFNIGTNAFEFVFEDTAIPIQNQTLISLDISQHFELCGNYVDVFFCFIYKWCPIL